MTQTPAGWYPEPDPTYTGPAGRLRYWDGAQWTQHVNDPAPVAPPVAPAYPAPYTAQPAPIQYGQQFSDTHGSLMPQPGVHGPLTPDGVPLAGWWWRVLARVLDSIIAIPLYALAAIPVIASQWDELRQWVDDLVYASDHNTANPPDPAIFDPSTGPGAALAVSIVAAYVIYEVAFLAWKQGTPGKLVLGMRVRLRDEPRLPFSAILVRVAFVGGLSALGNLPVAGIAFVIISLLDYLWPLWDSKKQSLHDKLAKTNVVKVR